MKRILFIIILVCSGCGVFAVGTTQKNEADQAYNKGQYQKAMEIYTTMLKSAENANIYYNLGNCYYRTKDMAHAVLCYERAHLLNPGDGDIRANLALAKSKTQDKVLESPQIFFITWWGDLINLHSSDQWAHRGIISFFLLLVSISIYIFGKKVRIRKIGFILALFFLVISAFSNLFAYQQKQALLDRGKAVVMSSFVTVRSTPSDSGTSLFVIHKGHVVVIKDNSMNTWKEIQLEDGNVGWMKTKDLEII